MRVELSLDGETTEMEGTEIIVGVRKENGNMTTFVSDGCTEDGVTIATLLLADTVHEAGRDAAGRARLYRVAKEHFASPECRNIVYGEDGCEDSQSIK